MSTVPFADIIILGLVAGFILLRLRSILGQQTGFDGTREPTLDAKRKEDIVIQLSEKLRTMKQDQAFQKASDVALPETLPDADRRAIESIRIIDGSFSVNEFLRGAKAAFEMVFDAFLKNDRSTIEMLLAPDVAKVFLSEAETRTKSERITETTLVAVESAIIKGASFNTPKARITVTFISEQVTVVRDSSGKIIEGDASQTERVEDEWIFERDITSKNPNWTVIDT